MFSKSDWISFVREEIHSDQPKINPVDKVVEHQKNYNLLILNDYGLAFDSAIRLTVNDPYK